MFDLWDLVNELTAVALLALIAVDAAYLLLCIFLLSTHAEINLQDHDQDTGRLTVPSLRIPSRGNYYSNTFLGLDASYKIFAKRYRIRPILLPKMRERLAKGRCPKDQVRDQDSKPQNPNEGRLTRMKT